MQKLHPILFNFKPSSKDKWVCSLVGVSGRLKGRSNDRIDGVDLLVSILKDGKNHNEDEVKIPKKVVIRYSGMLHAFNCLHLVFCLQDHKNVTCQDS